MRNWRILKWDKRPENPALISEVEFTCLDCMNDSMLKVHGRATAQLEQGLIFDPGEYSMPEAIECPHCRHRKELDV